VNETVKAPSHRRGAAVRAAVFEATVAEVVEHGVDAVNVAAIASRAGVHETSIYRRWRTRGDLIVDALLDRSALVIPAPDTGSIRGDLVELARLVIAYLSSPIGHALVRTVAIAVEDPTLAQARTTFLAGRLTAMRVLIDRAIGRDELAADTDVRLALELLVAPLHVRLLLTGEPLTDDLPEKLVDVLLDGLRKPAAE
jgi:AcrR family transcriptional regulator